LDWQKKDLSWKDVEKVFNQYADNVKGSERKQ
jgi:hypothetical protein